MQSAEIPRARHCRQSLEAAVCYLFVIRKNTCEQESDVVELFYILPLFVLHFVAVGQQQQKPGEINECKNDVLK